MPPSTPEWRFGTRPESPVVEPRWGSVVGNPLAPTGLSLNFQQTTNNEQDKMSDLDSINFHYNSMSILADESDWKGVASALIGDEEVEFKAQDLKKDNPIIRIWSRDKEALDRVLTKAAEAVI